MRDPDRIDRILDEIAFFWKAYPELRLMQLIINAEKWDDHPYYMEDEELLQNLRDLYG